MIETQLADFLGILVVGSALSVFIQWMKTRYATNGDDPNKIKMLTIALSVVVGGAYYFIRETIWYETIVGVLMAASTVYALLLKK